MIAAAFATFLLSFAETYLLMLLAALGVGLAGGSFAVGIAYVSKWYPKEKQGTALGIFGVVMSAPRRLLSRHRSCWSRSAGKRLRWSGQPG